MIQSKSQSGFTLIEMMVSVTIFIVVVTSATNLFILSSRTHKRVALKQRIQADARLALGTMVERVRVNRIDYDFYDSSTVSVESERVLALKDADDNSIVFSLIREELNPGVCPDSSSSPCLGISTDGGNNWDSLTAIGVRVPEVRFFIKPIVTPTKLSGSSYTTNVHPSVMISLTLRSSDPNPDFANFTVVQSTVSSRAYVR